MTLAHSHETQNITKAELMGMSSPQFCRYLVINRSIKEPNILKSEGNPKIHPEEDMNVQISRQSIQPVRGSPKSEGFTLCGDHESVQNLMAIHPVVVDVFQSGLKWWTDPLPSLEARQKPIEAANQLGPVKILFWL